MSCITKILAAKGDRAIVTSGGIAIEGGGTYRDYEYLITFVERGHRCGYVAVSTDDPVYHSKEEYPDDFEVHGGITFFSSPRFENFTGGHKCTDKWLGFDAMHGMDKQDLETSFKYFGESEELKCHRYFNSLMPKFSYDEDCEIRSYDYMEQECKNLIDQLIEVRNSV